jgi:hypothetical protein
MYKDILIIDPFDEIKGTFFAALSLKKERE